ncbi:ATP-binding cassette, subfamily C [Dyella jiangningensis]|uniref:ATP-binding cassette domain-containing protein n=1 Tax=Dyella sp. AtDHG13 TaxID=1938897 RepID=UPI000889B7E8|nr:ABC transporter ATP-binding protein [Dyella sp. AtDHG13]PXV55911.1 ATP-binding cassette subfamily C protein [Dyella sp. AtDHG13]SDK51196.1 ATP-binding cassette, subfamily C [Dyella jiangningensis]
MPGAWQGLLRERANGLPRSFFATLRPLGLWRIATYVALSLGSALTGGIAALLVAPMIQPGAVSGLGHAWPADTASMEMRALLFVIASAVFALVRWQAARLAARLASSYGMQLRGRVHESLIEAPLSSLADATSAELANVLTHNVELVTQGFNALMQLLVAGITTAVSLAFALWVSPPLVLAVPVIVACSLIAARFNSREHAAVSRRYVADMTRLFWMSEDFPRRWRHIKSFGQEQAEKAHHAAASGQLAEGYRRQLELIASGRLVIEMLAAAGIAAIFVVAHRWHGIDQASLIAVCLLLGRLLPYLVSTRQSFHQLASAVPAFALWCRYAGTLPSVPTSTMDAQAGQALRIESLSIDYPMALCVKNLWLHPGELLLIRGDSGIGKTSLADVLAGMIRPAAFTAWLGASRMDFDAYRAWVRNGAYVSQSVRPWQRTVRDCLRWAAADATDEDMQQALADVGLDRRLATQGQGLDATLDSSSGRLSGGEIQRLLLAQVLLRRPALAILDEATSALDAAAEAHVLATIRQRLPDTILIVISHRAGVASLANRSLTIGADLVVTIRESIGSAGRAEVARGR